MIPELRKKFNDSFTEDNYKNYLEKLDSVHPGALDFRVAETPLFVDKSFLHKMLTTCEEIIDVIVAPGFKLMTERSIPEEYLMPGEGNHPQFLVFDFGVCINADDEPEPQLIEMQGFPSLFAYQALHSEATSGYADIPSNFTPYLNGYSKESYVQLLKEIIIGNSAPENVILLEIYPESQKTRIDFYYTELLLGLQTVCLTKLKADGNILYYEKEGRKIKVERIYNRVIFDDLAQQKNLPPIIDLKAEYDVKWIPHPNWFYRISKFTLPFIDNPFVPETFFLDEIKEALPLDNYVLKPLFSFAGMGVVIDVTRQDIEEIKDPHNWILQKKVHYAPVIQTMDEPAKAEIRLFYFWKDDWKRPVAVLNLARLSKGKMIGTRYNKDKTWVGGSVAFFEQ